MAKLRQISEEVQELIDKLYNETGLVHQIELIAFDTPSPKKLIDIQRLNAFGESVCGREQVIGIIVYERAFERLTPEQQEMLMRDAFGRIKYDTEKDKLSIEQPQIAVTLGGRALYGEKLIDAVECGVLAIQQIMEEEKAEKERIKAEKAEKRAQKKMNNK